MGVRRSIGLFSAWAGATLLAIAVATAAVGSVRTQLTDKPTSIGVPTASLVTHDTIPREETVVETSSTTTTTLPVEQSTTTTAALPEESTTTTAAAHPPTPTPTTTSTTTTIATTTTVASESYTKTYDTEGGTVTIRVGGDSVTFLTAYPKPGWKVKVEKKGPEKVEVHFERNDDDDDDDQIEFKAKMDDGELKISIEND